MKVAAWPSLRLKHRLKKPAIEPCTCIHMAPRSNKDPHIQQLSNCCDVKAKENLLQDTTAPYACLDLTLDSAANTGRRMDPRVSSATAPTITH